MPNVLAWWGSLRSPPPYVWSWRSDGVGLCAVWSTWFDVGRAGCGGMVGFAALTATLRSGVGFYVCSDGVVGEF